jgi:hypothetical protein
VSGTADIIFVEIDITDPSNFDSTLDAKGVELNGYRVLRAESPAARNAIAAILRALRDTTGVIPHAYFEWSEGSPWRTSCATSSWAAATHRRAPVRQVGGVTAERRLSGCSQFEEGH